MTQVPFIMNPTIASRGGGGNCRRHALSGFTVIELLVVLAAIALLLSIATPRYVQHLDHARETALKEDLHQMRLAIDHFYSDRGRYPADLEELVKQRYLRALPEDPVTDSSATWVSSPAPDGVLPAVGENPGAGPGVADVHSGAQGNAQDGSSYASW